MNREELEDFIKEYCGINPECLWVSHPTYVVYRHSNNRKWFAVIMDIPQNKLGIDKEGNIQVVNLKCDPLLIGSLITENGIYKGYHMNKNHWITVCLDGSIDDNKIKWLLEISYELTNKG